MAKIKKIPFINFRKKFRRYLREKNKKLYPRPSHLSMYDLATTIQLNAELDSKITIEPLLILKSEDIK